MLTYHRVSALLGKAGVIDNPEATFTHVHVGNDPLGHQTQQLLIASLGFSHKVMQRLMFGKGSARAAKGSTLLHASGSIRPVQ